MRDELWIVNFTKRDLLIDDLGIRVSAGKQINLFSKSYHFTDKQIEDSINIGSICKKRDRLIIRNSKLNTSKASIYTTFTNSNDPSPSRHKSKFTNDVTSETLDELIDQDFESNLEAWSTEDGS